VLGSVELDGRVDKAAGAVQKGETKIELEKVQTCNPQHCPVNPTSDLNDPTRLKNDVA